MTVCLVSDGFLFYFKIDTLIKQRLQNQVALEKPSPSHAVLAHCHASSLPRAQNLGRTRPMDADRDDGLAVASLAQDQLLEHAYAGDMVGARNPEYLAAA
jgi:hypothetical protein